jgi:hypothetical protein
MLGRAGVRRVSADEAKALCGLAEAGLWLPYRDLEGNAIRDGGEDYGRLRLDKPQGKRKYHQAAGTTVHAYLPPKLADTPNTGGDLFLIEGEFKSLALAESGHAAVGISGFYGFGLPAGEELVPELLAVLAQRRPDRILFCGDADTAMNHQFALASVRLANLVKPIPVMLPRIPVSAPGKGVDDCRAVLNGKFADWWQERIAKATGVTAETNWSRLALELFEAETEAMASITGAARLDLEQRLVKFAASFKLDPLLQGRIRNVATQQLGLAKRDFDRAVTKLEKHKSSRQGRQPAEGQGREIDHDQPAAVWVREVWESVSGLLFQYSKQTCRLHQGQLQPQSPAAMVSFLDHPERCHFQTRDRNGEEVRSSFTEADARIFLASWMDVSDLVQTVEVFSSVPVLAWDGQQAVLVNGYNRALRILAGGTAVTLPSPREAVALLVRLLQDYDFVTHGDLGRAMALLLSPALAQGGFLGKGRVPLFLVEKNEASAGGSLLLRLTAHIYGLRPQPISKLDKPDKVGEDISRLLLSGAGFLYFDNARGRGLEKLPELESLLTEPIFTCRAPYLHGEADVTRRVLAVSSNGAVFSRDLATRTVKINIRKQPAGYAWADHSEGSIEDHVVAKAAQYLGAAFSLVKDWADQGRPVGKHLTGFRFSQWERACAWILERHFPGLPLLDASHQEAQAHLSDPSHDFLRNLFRLVVEGESRGELTASSLAEIATAAGLLEGDEQQNRLKIGKIMRLRFPQDGQHRFDGDNYRVERESRLSSNGNGHEVAFYRIYRKECVE